MQNVLDTHITKSGDIFSMVSLSPTQADIYYNQRIGYPNLSIEEAAFYMTQLKRLFAKKSVKICICRCHNKIESPFDETKHCTFCLSGRFIK